MTDLQALTAAAWRIETGGVEYSFAPLSLADWGTIERRVLEGRSNPIDIAKAHLAGLATDEKRLLLDSALRQASAQSLVTPHELAAFLATLEGLALLVWLSLQKGQPGMTKEDAWALLGQLQPDRLEPLITRIADLSSPEYDSKN